MSHFIRTRLLRKLSLFGFLLLLQLTVRAQSNVVVRVMSSNLPGNSQAYEAAQIRILQGLKPDIVAIQEFNYAGNSASEIRAFVDTAFGTNFHYYRESGYQIPNGVISRWPIIGSGSWDDTESPNRGFAWAHIDLPGTNDLYVVSVHFLTSGDRAAESSTLKTLIQANFPANAWIIVGGDMNSTSRTSTEINTFKTYLSDSPIPDDNDSPTPNENTNEPRSEPYDYVLPSFSLTNRLTNVVFASHSFPRGLVFDSRVYTPLGDVAPVLFGDSELCQHMAVLKAFLISVDGTNPPTAPAITAQPQDLTVPLGSNATFTVTADGTAPLAYQWRFAGTNIGGATTNTYTRFNAQTNDAGNYTVVVTNAVGSVTSAIAVLTVNSAPIITNQPQSLTVTVGQSATFTIGASGAAPLAYQWRFIDTNLPGATASSFNRASAQLSDAGNYVVVITNTAGSVTSSIASLTVNEQATGLTTLAGWDVSGQTNFGLSPLVANTNAANLTIVGLTRGAGVGTGGTAAARAWGGTGFDSASAAAAASAGDFATFSLAANNGYQVSFHAISRFDYRRSGTGPQSGVLQYQVGSGAFTDITTLAYTNSTSSGSLLGPISLSSITALQNVAASNAVTFRIVSHGGAAGGTWYVFDVANSTALDLAVQGSITAVAFSNPPPAAAVLSGFTFNAPQFQMLVTGSAGTNYIVQSATNIATPDWISLRTNSSPFTFTDTNTAAFPVKFYRALWQP